MSPYGRILACCGGSSSWQPKEKTLPDGEPKAWDGANEGITLESSPTAPVPSTAAAAALSYEIRPLTQQDGPRMISFLRRLFFRDEPLNVAVQLVQPGEETCRELEDYCLSSLPDNLSLMAVDAASGEMLAVCINGIHEPGGEAEGESAAAQCPNPRFRRILQLLTFVDARASAELASRFPDPADRRQLEVRVVSVDTAARGRGLATALISRSSELAKQHGIPLVRIDCTSHYSARAASRLGFECIFSVPYAQYERDGDVVFTPAEPHKEVATCIKRVI
ncbi:arylalkylamine N-acetyltransferase 1-like [Schistocerca piceifrons]|uniref:arylalkylamine N-acetyltransferase 1-like n=1 Tax=Schistocerca piceifrons TaxID=274613 RepID=UPI001F5EA434|nr:arylalkylamine N-acetyltransferase 1-like [Schistocerca piceifrons]